MTDEYTGLREYSVSVELAVDLTDKLAAIVNQVGFVALFEES